MRLVNFEILRTVSMLMVVAWHFFVYGVRLVDNPMVGSSVGWGIYPFLQYFVIVCGTGVNLFVLISSYFLIDKQFKLYRIIKTWSQVVLTYFIIVFLVWLYTPEKISFQLLIKGLIPIHENTYWFVSQYIGLLLVAPFLSLLAKTLKKKQYQRLLVVMIVVFTNLSFGYPFGETMQAYNGFSLVWFCVLFLFGGYIKLYGFPYEKSLRCFHILITGLIIFVIMVSKLMIRYFLYSEDVVYIMPTYNSLVFFLSLMIFLWFKNHNFSKSKFIKILSICAPFTFGVYLVHEHPAIRELLWHSFDLRVLLNDIRIIYCLPFLVICVFSFSTFVDYGRYLLFKCFKIDVVINDVSYWVESKIKKIV